MVLKEIVPVKELNDDEALITVVGAGSWDVKAGELVLELCPFVECQRHVVACGVEHILKCSSLIKVFGVVAR